MTEKEIVQMLRACASGEAEECPFTEKYGCDGCPKVSADLIERLTAENAALREKVPQWISVRDRLPKLGERVIATDGVSAGEAYMGVSGELQRLDLPLRWLTLTGNDATHWMPFPEVPKEGDKHGTTDNP